jgi:hypothetical protein
MAYYETAIGATANPASAMMTALDPLLTANGWEFVETYTASTDVSNIYRSPAASNSTGTDFYIAVNRTATTATTVALCIFEEWNASTKRAIKYAPNGTPTAGSNIPGSVGEVQDTTGVLPSATTANASLFKSAGFTLSTAGWTYYLNINADRIIGCTTIGNNGFYCGAYDSFYNTSRPALCTVEMGDGTTFNTTSYGATTRENLTTAAAGNWHIGEYKASLSSSLYYNQFAPYRYSLLLTDPYTSQNLIFKKNVLHTRSNHVDILGLYKDVLISSVGSSTGSPGDTLSYTVGGTTYNYVSGTKNNVGESPATYWIPKQ